MRQVSGGAGDSNRVGTDGVPVGGGGGGGIEAAAAAANGSEKNNQNQHP